MKNNNIILAGIALLSSVSNEYVKAEKTPSILDRTEMVKKSIQELCDSLPSNFKSARAVLNSDLNSLNDGMSDVEELNIRKHLGMLINVNQIGVENVLLAIKGEKGINLLEGITKKPEKSRNLELFRSTNEGSSLEIASKSGDYNYIETTIEAKPGTYMIEHEWEIPENSNLKISVTPLSKNKDSFGPPIKITENGMTAIFPKGTKNLRINIIIEAGSALSQKGLVSGVIKNFRLKEIPQIIAQN